MCGLTLAAALLLPQGDLHLQQVAIDGLPATAVAVALPFGWQHDPDGAAGLTAAAAGYLQLRGRAQLGEAAGVRVEVLDDSTVFTAMGADPAALRDWVAGLLDGGGAEDGDALALARARAALAADDAEHVFPGLVLQSRARRALLRGQPGGFWSAGEPRQIQALDLAAVLAQARRLGQGEAWLAVLGPGGFAAPDVAPRAPAASPTPVVRALPADGELLQPLPSLGGVFVAWALPVPPPSCEALPGALAMAAVQLRAAERLQARGREWSAQAPACAYDWLAGAPLAVLIRRGPDRAPLARPRAELEALRQDLVDRPLLPAELAAARQRLLGELQLPPYPPALAASWRQVPEALPARARALALCCRRQWPLDLPQRLLAVPLGAVQAALAQLLGGDGQGWFAVGPAADRPGG